jgi:hypothetical protein
MITVAGGTGLVGKTLTQALVGDGEQVREASSAFVSCATRSCASLYTRTVAGSELAGMPNSLAAACESLGQLRSRCAPNYRHIAAPRNMVAHSVITNTQRFTGNPPYSFPAYSPAGEGAAVNLMSRPYVSEDF